MFFHTIKILNFNKFRYVIYFLGLFGVLILIALFVNIFNHQSNKTIFNPEQYLGELDKPETSFFEEVRDSLDTVIEQWGVQAAIDLNEYAFTNQKYGIYQCHVVMHLLGHEAVAYYGSDFETIINRNIHFCELGYQHGAEAQVALNGGDYKDELYRLCDLIHKKTLNSTCFHGAGHAFMNDSLDVNKSLKLCDDLINETYTLKDMAPCYNSVFAELTNLVGGTDGATGIEYTGGPPLKIDEETPIAYCSKFGERYKTECMFEFSGLGVSTDSTDAEIEKKLIECTTGEYDEVLESACIQSVSAVGAQHLLAHNTQLVVPQSVFTFSSSTRTSYIIGAGTEMKQYIISGVNKDWESFCSSFLSYTDRVQCRLIFTQ